MNKIFVCQVDELDEGEALKVDCGVNGIEALAVFNNGGEFFAMNDKCSHGNASMSEGYLEDDGTVECPLHSARFCLKTGEALCLPATDPIKTFPVIVEPTEVEGEYDVYVTYLLYRTQKEKDVTIYCGKRHDKIRKVEGGLGFQIFNRKITLDQVTYNSHNLSVFF